MFFALIKAKPIVVSMLLALGCVAVVIWIRTIPWSLKITDTTAENLVASELRRQAESPGASVAGGSTLDGIVREAIRLHPGDAKAARAAVAARLRQEFTFVAADARRYPHLDNYDSYLWLRHARNYLRSGTTCDSIAAGECRDDLANAPVGSQMIYNRSLHIAGIVAVHKAATFFDSGYPLAASAYWVPVIVGALGAIAAFFAGRLLAGNVAGLIAAIVISVQPVFLARSVGSDNDVWNVVLPLFTAWAVIAALQARKKSAWGAYGVLAGVATALHAATWSGWSFTYIVVLFSLFAYTLLCGVRLAIYGRSRDGRDEVYHAASLLAVYYLAAGLLTWILGAGGAAFTAPITAAAEILGNVQSSRAVNVALWPQTLRTVAEVGRPAWSDMAAVVGGRIIFFIGCLGLPLSLLPRGGWKPRYVALLAWTALLYITLFRVELPAWAVVALFAAPFATELLVGRFDSDTRGDRFVREGCSILMIVWFLAAFVMYSRAVRFFLLFEIPFGFAFAVAVERLRILIDSEAVRFFDQKRLISAVTFGVVLVLLGYPVSRGYKFAAGMFPAMNSAWWETLVKIRGESRPDAIVNAWWDYGHWIKYAAERRVTSDGASLRTHVPHWLAKALLAPTDDEAIGLFRMLNCGSDATPLPEGAKGAFGKLTAAGFDDFDAYSILSDVVELEREEAELYLSRKGLSREQQASVLASTHCKPPESFLILSNKIGAGSWLRLGTWDVGRAHLARKTRLLPKDRALEEMTAKRGFDYNDAAAIYDALAAMTREQLQNFIAPALRVLPGGWAPCHAGDSATATRRCMATIAGDRNGAIGFSYDPAFPDQGVLKVDEREGHPRVVLVARAPDLVDVTSQRADFSDVGVLLDPVGERILIGDPMLLRSTLVRLFYLGEKYTKRFRLFDRRQTLLGDDVITWRINWPEP
jgi:Oligosaccharyl transferase STT3 subunit